MRPGTAEAYRQMRSVTDLAGPGAAQARAAAAKAKTFVARPIRHPNFRNVSLEEGVLLLAEQPAGEPLLRPSHKGTHLIVLCLKARPPARLCCKRVSVCVCVVPSACAVRQMGSDGVHVVLEPSLTPSTVSSGSTQAAHLPE